MADVFISYKRSERSRVEKINDLLRKESISVWFDSKLEAGKGEGFDAEIEREVTSAGCVIVCWTREALRSVYVKAEAKKGLERDVLMPVFLEPCKLPIPFNAIDTVDLSGWQGRTEDPNWQRVLSLVKERVEISKQDSAARKARSAAAYERVDDLIYPGTIDHLVRKIAALHERDADIYQTDIEALLSWIYSIAKKELKYVELGYDLAERQDGGGAWMFWDSGDAAKRSAKIKSLLEQFNEIQETLSESTALLDLQAP